MVMLRSEDIRDFRLETSGLDLVLLGTLRILATVLAALSGTVTGPLHFLGKLCPLYGVAKAIVFTTWTDGFAVLLLAECFVSSLVYQCSC